MAGAIDDLTQFLQILARWFLSRECAEKYRKLRDEFLILEYVFRDAPCIDGGVVEEFEPVLVAPVILFA